MACQTGKSSNDSQTCKTRGVVQDFTGMDGCNLLIVLEDGKKLLPGQILNSSFQLAAGQKIRLDYRPIDMMSICMTEDLIVEITCIELIP
jgi:hypothetical protein